MASLLIRLRPFVVYAAMGLATAGVYFAVLAVLLEILVLDYRIAVSISYFVGVLFNFYANKYVTFKNRGTTNIMQQLGRYSVVVCINYLLTMVIVMFVVERLHQAPYVGAWLSTGATALVGYSCSKYWIFKKEDARE